MNYDGFLAKFPPGTVLDNYGGQCVSLIANYLDFNGLHAYIAYANAKDWADHPTVKGAFNWIRNNPSDLNQIPSRGDIIVWNGLLPGSGGYGHIAIWDRRVSPGVFSSYDNNWGGRYCHFVNHNYDYVIGWYTRKVSTAPVQGDEMIASREEAIVQYQLLRPNGSPSEAEIAGTVGKRTYKQFLNDAKPEMEQRNAGLRAQAVQITNLTNLNNSLNAKITEITSNATATKAEKDKALADIAKLQAELTTAMDKLKEAQAKPEVPPQPPMPAPDTPDVSAFKQVVAFIKKLLNIKE